MNLGSKEYLIVEVTEVLGDLTTLEGATCTFDILDPLNNLVIDGQAVDAITGMKCKCLVDTTSGFTAQRYRLYLNILTVPGGSVETPRLGPFVFNVDV